MTIGTSVTCGACGATRQLQAGLPEATSELIEFGLAHEEFNNRLELWITRGRAGAEATFVFASEVINERMCQWIGLVLIDDNGAEVCEVVADPSKTDANETWRVDQPDGRTQTFASKGQALAAARTLVKAAADPLGR